MGSNYYIKNKNSIFEHSSIPEDEYVEAILSIAKNHGVKITDDMILQEVEKRGWQQSRNYLLDKAVKMQIRKRK